MRILILLGSPHKSGATAVLAQKIDLGAALPPAACQREKGRSL